MPAKAEAACTRRWALGAAVLAGLACAGDPLFLTVRGTWHFIEMFQDEIHQVACVGEGTLALAQDNEAADPSAASTASAMFTGSGAIDNECTSLDGPFEYFGSSTITGGALASVPRSTIAWEATVNEASCRYQGEATGDGFHGTEMSGTLACTLQQADVTFNFVGEWIAHSGRSEWCEVRRSLSGCEEPQQ